MPIIMYVNDPLYDIASSSTSSTVDSIIFILWFYYFNT